MLLSNVMKSVLEKIPKCSPIQYFKTKKKAVFLSLSLFLFLTILIIVFLSTKTKPNDDIALLPSNSSSIYQNKNPNFLVDFGKRDNPEQQWIRFESKNSKRNPFDKSKKSFFQKIKNFFSPIKSYGIEISLHGVNLTDINRLNISESEIEKVRKVSEILGDNTVKTSTKLVELGRELGTNQDIAKKTIVNGNIVNSVDLEYQIIKGKGLKEEIIIKNLDGYTQECRDDISKCKLPPNEFVFDMKLDEGLSLKKGWFTIKQKSFETYYFEDSRGKYVSHFLPSFAIDKAGGKTYDVSLSVEDKGSNKYDVKVEVPINWLLDKNRVFPIRIDPTIVHDVQDDFDTGIYSGTEYVQSASGVQIAGMNKPVSDSSTVGYWDFNNTGFNDASGKGHHVFKMLHGLRYGIQHSNLSFVLNQYNGVANPYEIDIVCPSNNDTNCNIVDSNGQFYTNLSINSGIAVSENTTGLAYIMYSPSLSAQSITAGVGNSNNFIVVRHNGSNWQYNNDTTWVNFAPKITNFIVAKVNLFSSVEILDMYPSLTDGVIYKAVEFDGVNDHLRLEDATKADIVGDITVEFWIKLTKAEVQTILHKDTQYSVRLNENGYITWADSSEWDYSTFGFHNIGLELAKWTHVAITKSGGIVKIYADGVEKVSKSFGGSITSTNKILHIGCYSGTSACAVNATYSSAVIDELKISNVARNADQIYKSYIFSKSRISGEYLSSIFDSNNLVSNVNVSSEIFGESTGDVETPFSTTGLVAQWKFNEVNGNTASSGGNCGITCNGTLSNFANTTGQDKVANSGWTYDNRRWGSGGLMFDGINDNVRLTSGAQADIVGDISVEFWFKPTKFYDQVIIHKERQYSVGINQYGYLSWADSSNWSFAQFGYFDVGIRLGEWNYVVITKSESTVKLYANGILHFTKTFGSAITSTTNILHFGCYSNANSCTAILPHSSMILDELRIYNRVLTASEVASNHNSNSVMYSLRGGNSNNPNDGTWSEWKDNTTYTTLKSFDNKYLYDEAENGLVGYWSMDEESGNTVADVSGKNNNGTSTNTTVVNGKFGKGRSIVANTQYIEIPNSSNLNINGTGSQVTMSAWFNASSLSAHQTLIFKGDGNTDSLTGIYSNRQYALFLLMDGSLHLSATSVNNVGVTETVLNTANHMPPILPNTWNHVVAIIDSIEGSMKIYVNGIFICSGPFSTTGIRQGNGNLYFGLNSTNYQQVFPYSGVLDEVKIYNKVLSSDIIQSKYLQGIGKKHTLVRNTSVLSASSKSDVGDKSHIVGNTRKDGLLSHWKLDEKSGNQVKDSVGNNNGTATGTTIIDGKLGKGRSFNGTNEYVRIPEIDVSSLSVMSASVWVKTTTTEPSSMFFISRGLFMYINRFTTNGKVLVDFDDNSSNNNASHESITVINDGKWHLVTGTNDGSKTRLYIDGVLENEFNSTFSLGPAGENTYLGAANGVSNFFNGALDEVKIYRKVLSPEEIFEEYASLKNVFEKENSNIIGYWNMNEGSGNISKDIINGFNGTATGTTIINSIAERARNFNGTSDRVSLGAGSQANISGDITVSVWVNIASGSTNAHTIVHKQDQYSIRILPQGLITWADSSLYNYGAFGSHNIGLQLDKWQHIVLTKTGGIVKIYLNGVEKASVTFGGAITGNNNIMHIGCYSNATTCAGAYLKGSVDELKIYNRAISPAEVIKDYRAGMGRNSFSKSTYVNYSLDQQDLSNKISLPMYIASPNVGEEIRATIGESAYANYQPDQYTVGLWHLNDLDGNGTYIKDDSAYGNDGIPVGTVYIPNGQMGGARSFNSSNTDYIAVNDSPSLNPSAITLEAWIKPRLFEEANIISKGGNNGFRFKLNDGSGLLTLMDRGSTNYIYTSKPLRLNEWTHVVGTADASGLKIYINGVLDVANTTPYGTTTTTSPLYIGTYGNLQYFTGDIDEVRISNKARSADEIRQAYEVGLRTHNIKVQFRAKLDPSNLVTGNSDKAFTVDATQKGLRNKGSNIHIGEKIIIREKNSSGEYLAQGIVNSANEDTGAITVNSWDNISTFPAGGFTTKADVFKWQKEYLPIKGRTVNTHLDQSKLLTLRVSNKYDSNDIWIDNLSATEYPVPTYPQNISFTNSYRFFQYRGVLTTTNRNITPIVRQVQLDYTPEGPTMEQIMRHGKWFGDNQKQPFWWAK